MKKLKIIILALAGIFVAGVVILTVVVPRFAGPFVAAYIEKSLKTGARVGRVRIGLPLSVTLTGLELKDFASVEEISVYPSLLGMLSGKIVLNKATVTHPVITLVRAADGAVLFPFPRPEQKKTAPAVFLAALSVKRGEVTFIDKTVSNPGYALVLESVGINITKVAPFPGSRKVRYAASAQIADIKGSVPGTLVFSGWIDLGPKNMEGLMQLSGVEIASFAPYYGHIISAKKLLSAKLDFKADMKANNNDLTAACRLVLRDLLYAPDPAPEGSSGIPDVFPGALDFFADENGVVTLDFPIRTKLDSPALDAKVLQKAIMDAALKKLSNKPQDKNLESMGSVVDEFKQLKENLKDTLKK